MADLSADDQLKLIFANLQESMNPEIIEDIIHKEHRAPIIYWGTATTGKPHCGYFVPGLKIAQFLQAGCKVKILLADVHGFLDNLKAPKELVAFRAEYYKHTIIALLQAVNVPIDKLEFVLGSSYQYSPAYFEALLTLSTQTSGHDAQKAGAEVVKQSESPPLSGLIYPLMQALDEEFLGVDAQFGGVDQRKIFALAKEALPKLGYKERAHLMNPMVPGLAGGKMSASDPDSKIDLLDSAEVVRRKLKKAFAKPKEVEGNGLMSFVEFVLLPAGALRGGKPRFVVERRDEEPLVYTDIEEMHRDYEADVLTPQLLKSGVQNALIPLLESIQQAFQASPKWQEIEKKAYPPPVEQKKKKEKKDKGSKYPGAAKGVVAQPDGSVEGPRKQEVDVARGPEAEMERLQLEKEVQEAAKS